jgi:23S rRNA (cytidine1920-2'-O)/16S rRNA (cytidine1409-2'-O)-methyltransferase
MPARKVRLDALLVDRGLAASRERARALVLAGRVRVDGRPAGKPGHAVAAASRVELLTPDHPYVGRGGLKLACALETFGIPVAGRRALDVGASTGGFTDVLLRSGAAHVVALDVGRGQIDSRLRSDPRVIVLEGVNARYLTAASLPPGHRAFDLVTVDVSFIGVRHVLGPLVPLLAPGADVIVLVKPQFEAGRKEVGKGGIVRDPRVQARVVEEVTGAGHRVGLSRVGLTASPIQGAEGNREFLLHFRLTQSPATVGEPTAADGG